jgi:hypothetical protein
MRSATFSSTNPTLESCPEAVAIETIATSVRTVAIPAARKYLWGKEDMRWL